MRFTPIDDEVARDNIDRLHLVRTDRGFTTKDLSNQTGISSANLSSYERGDYYPTIKNYNKLAKVFNWGKLSTSKPQKRLNKDYYETYEKRLQEAREGHQRMEQHFVARKCYQVINRNYHTNKAGSVLGSQCWDNDVIFVYQGKQGIHHLFTSKLGGWSRTYTDYQLVDKKIMEVK